MVRCNAFKGDSLEIHLPHQIFNFSLEWSAADEIELRIRKRLLHFRECSYHNINAIVGMKTSRAYTR